MGVEGEREFKRKLEMSTGEGPLEQGHNDNSWLTGSSLEGCSIPSVSIDQVNSKH